MPADPRSARQAALADLHLAHVKTKNAVASALAAMASSIAKANAEADAAAQKARAKVSGVDHAAAAQAAKEAQNGGGGAAPPDITKFFPPTAVGGAPGGGGTPPSFADLVAGAGGSANAVANRAVAPARQAAGTLPSTASQAPQQMAGGGGMQAPGGQSVNIGGQTFSAPDTMTTTRETTRPMPLGTGLFWNATTREVITEQNVLRAGDILSARQNQVQFEETQRTNAANFKMQFDLRSRQSAVGMATDLMRTTDAPPAVATAAAGAYLAGNDAVAAKMLAPFGSVGAAQITAENSRARLLDAQSRVAEAEAGLAAGTLYDPSVMLGLPINPKPITASETAGILASVNDDMAKVMSGASGLAAAATGGEGDSGKASRIENIGLRLSKVGQILVVPKPAKTRWWQGSPGQALTQLPATTAFVLLDIALNDDYSDPKLRDRARAVAEAYGLGSTATMTDKAGNTTKHFVATTGDLATQPWVDRVHRAVSNHSPELMDALAGRYGDEVLGLIADYEKRTAGTK